MTEFIISLIVGSGLCLSVWYGWGLAINLRELRERNPQQAQATAAKDEREPQPPAEDDVSGA